MTRKTPWILGIGAMAGCYALTVAQRTEDSAVPAPDLVVPPKISQTSVAPTVSQRSISPVGVLSSRKSKGDELPPGIASPPPPSLREEVESQIAASGPRAAAIAVRDDLIILPSEKLARIEEVARQWSLGNPGETWDWIESQMEENQSEAAFNQAAISGYIESVASIDPEAAANASDLLDPTAPNFDVEGQASTHSATSADPGYPGDQDFLTPNRK